MTTLREHLEAIIRRTWADFPASGNYADAVAALAILDAAEFGHDVDYGWREDRLIPDPGKNPELREDAA